MDQYLIYFAPFIVVGFGIMLAPLMPVRFAEFCATMVNGIWVAGLTLVILTIIGVPLPVAAVVSWLVMFFAGQYFSRLSDEWQARSNEIKRCGREERIRREKEKRTSGS